MGRNNEYSDDIPPPLATDESSEDEGDYELELQPEDWHDWNSEHILNMWMSLRQYLEDNHLHSRLLTFARYHDFAEFVRSHST